MRDTNAHIPAMSLQEAAMLPAIAPANPGHITMPLDKTHFVPVRMTQDTTLLRQGSPAGRAILRAAGVNLPGVSRMGCAARRRVRVEMDCDAICDE
ncbi:MAG: hypothetical protein E7316_02580 [Clostridiales bacterium]|nr:hypothetical protein [Clostridiales bacterium]